ncbi:MAG: type 4a pilus biogenesis protein PilO [Candidatus Saccharimonadales bacterium]
MAQTGKSIKRNLISKANTTIVIVTAGACFVVVFSLIASITLVGQFKYQNKVISAKREARDTVKKDIEAAKQLTSSYQAFTSTSQNVLGGDPNGTGSQDGDNAKIILDALPAKYDFPAMATSLEKILSNQSVTIRSIAGTDDVLNTANASTSASPQAIAMPFKISVTGNYDSVHNVLKALESSIRPMDIQIVSLSGSQAEISMEVTAQTYYQPGKDLKISTKIVQSGKTTTKTTAKVAQ